MPAAGADEAATFLRRELAGFLGPLAGEKPEEAVSVDVRQETVEGATVPMAEVRIRPAIRVENKAVEFGFVLPL
jgi:hypothetical protein